MSTLTPESQASGDASKALAKKVLACVSCTQRKVKCDRQVPCGHCKRTGAACVPVSSTGSRQRRRRFPERELLQRLRQYESLLRKHEIPFEPLHGEDGLKRHDDGQDPSDERADEVSTQEKRRPDKDAGSSTGAVGHRHTMSNSMKAGKLLTGKPGQGRTRYVDSHFLRDLDIADGDGDDDWQRLTDDEGERDYSIVRCTTALTLDPLTGALMSPFQSLLNLYPSHSEAMSLLRIHAERVDPLAKILHIPSVTAMFNAASLRPETVEGKADACLFFAICHFSVFVLTDVECEQRFGQAQSRAALLQKYHFAARQALVNVQFLKTTELVVLQAFTLFLLSCKNVYDPQTYWILTGVARRISTRLGLHRDGEKQGLPPFDVEMRRRLSYQIIPLDGQASHHAGVGMGRPPDFDTLQPTNANDSEIWPGMPTPPEEQKAATEMMYCRARSHIGLFFAKAGAMIFDRDSWHAPDVEEVDHEIDLVESEVEERFLRYCDVVEPLHFLTICSARSAIAAMRLRVRLAKMRAGSTSEAERKRAWELALKIMDTDTAASSNTSLRRFAWHMRSFFIWGSWDSLIFLLTSVRKNDGTLLAQDVNAAWSRVEATYTHHTELLDSSRALPEAVGRVTLKAWEANAASDRFIEPSFITTLRSQRENKARLRAAKEAGSTPGLTGTSATTSPTDMTSAGSGHAPLGTFAGTMDLDMNADFSVGSTEDWAFWDQMIRDYQALPDPLQGQELQQTFGS